jgi:solute:Na+ symporter, SSS family
MVLTTLDLAIIALYFVAMLAIGVLVMRRASKNLDSYYLGGHSLPWWVLGLSNASSMWDIAGTMWLVYNLYVYGLKGTWLPWLWPTFNQIILMVFLAGWIRRSGVLTGAEWISTRFGRKLGVELSRAIIVVFALVSVVAFIGYAFQGIGKFAQVFLPWEWSASTYAMIIMSVTAVYVLMGGMLSVVLTDLAQFFIMLACALILAFIAMAQVPAAEVAALVPAGWGDLFFGWKLDLDWSGLIPALEDNLAEDGYTLFGLFFMAMVCKGLLVSLAGPAPNYDMQRVLAARSPREAGMMSGLVSLALLPRWLLIAAITLIGLKYLGPRFAAADPAYLRGDGTVDFELILPFVIREFVPVGLTGLLLAGLLAAFMSTFSSTLNAAGAYLVNDLYKRYLVPAASSRHLLFASYGSQLLVLGIGFLVGLNLSSVDQITKWIVNGLFGGYTAANILKWYWWRLNGIGYFCGMLVGIASAIVVPLFIFPEADSLGDLLKSFPLILALSLAGSIFGSLASAPEEPACLDTFYRSVRPWGFWGPVRERALAELPGFTASSFKRDAVNTLVGLVWQVPLWTIPVFLVFRDFRGLWISLAVFLVASAFLKKNWYDRLPKDTGESVRNS